MAVSVTAAFAVGFFSPLGADAILLYFLAALIGIVAYRTNLRLALVGVPLAMVAYRGTLDLAFRESPSDAFAASALVLLLGVAVAAGIAGSLHREDRAIRFSRQLPNCVGYDTFSLFLAKDIARCQRYKSAGAVALLHLRNLEALTKPDAYQQHDLILSRILDALSNNIRRSDMACYLGDLHFAISFSHTNSEQAWKAVNRLRVTLAPVVARLWPSLKGETVDIHAVCVEYPQDGATPSELLETAARTLGVAAEQRIEQMEKQLALQLRQLEKLGYA
jgi:GGDEF domain-containing protein